MNILRATTGILQLLYTPTKLDNDASEFNTNPLLSLTKLQNGSSSSFSSSLSEPRVRACGVKESERDREAEELKRKQTSQGVIKMKGMLTLNLPKMPKLDHHNPNNPSNLNNPSKIPVLSRSGLTVFYQKVLFGGLLYSENNPHQPNPHCNHLLHHPNHPNNPRHSRSDRKRLSPANPSQLRLHPRMEGYYRQGLSLQTSLLELYRHAVEGYVYIHTYIHTYTLSRSFFLSFSLSVCMCVLI